MITINGSTKTSGTASLKNTPVSGNAAAGEVVLGSDTRLTDSRTPLAHSHVLADVTSLVSSLAAKASTATTITVGTGMTGGGDLSANRTIGLTFGTTSGTVADGADSRFTNARTPTAHAASHATGQSDPITLSAIGAASTTHASTHSTGQSDPISPANIGALSTGALTSTTPADPKSTASGSATTGAAGSSSSVARVDHVHPQGWLIGTLAGGIGAFNAASYQDGTIVILH